MKEIDMINYSLLVIDIPEEYHRYTNYLPTFENGFKIVFMDRFGRQSSFWSIDYLNKDFLEGREVEVVGISKSFNRNILSKFLFHYKSKIFNLTNTYFDYLNYEFKNIDDLIKIIPPSQLFPFENPIDSFISLLKSKEIDLKTPSLIVRLIPPNYDAKNNLNQSFTVNELKMKKIKLGQEPAFPIKETKDTESIELGISKRFYAACAAMQGLLSMVPHLGKISDEIIKADIDLSFRYADELLKQEYE